MLTYKNTMKYAHMAMEFIKEDVSKLGALDFEG